MSTGARDMLTVLAMWKAHRDGRVDDMLEQIHPHVIWMPVSRPGRTLYEGHEGVREMLADARAAHGDYVIEVDDLTGAEPGVVVLLGRIVAADPRFEELPIEMIARVREGKILEVETQLRAAVVVPDMAYAH